MFCSDAYLLHLNKEYLTHDYFTDILTFEYQSEPIMGELYISIDRVKDNAEKLHIGFLEELNRVIIHGVLHLCGYGDQDTAAKEMMTSREDFYLQQL